MKDILLEWLGGVIANSPLNSWELTHIHGRSYYFL